MINLSLFKAQKPSLVVYRVQPMNEYSVAFTKLWKSGTIKVVDDCVCVSCGIKGTNVVKYKHIGELHADEHKGYHTDVFGLDANGNIGLLTIDHILPKSKGGGNWHENYQVMCEHCNSGVKRSIISDTEWSMIIAQPDKFVGRSFTQLMKFAITVRDERRIDFVDLVKAEHKICELNPHPCKDTLHVQELFREGNVKRWIDNALS